MNVSGESDGFMVPMNSANNGGTEPPAEPAEGRGPARRSARQSNLVRTQKPERRRSRGLLGVREAAHKDRSLKFTALLHHITPELLTASFYDLKKNAAPGVDSMTWHEYEQDLEDRIAGLHGRIHRGAFRVKSSKRVYIEKAGGKRPLGIPSLEDKIAQHALLTVLQCIYEADFLGFSYGFRPRRSPHQALDALYVGITEKRVVWILDADIEGFFDNIDRDCLVKFIEHRVGDGRVVRLIRKWLNARIIEETDWSDSGKGTPQGAILSPLLANVFRHYVLDLRINTWRNIHARDQCVVVRYADDFVIGFERENDARACLTALAERFEKFGLRLHPDKTRLIEFGRGSAAKRKREGRGKCETFDFLGFTHICSRTRNGKRFSLLRHTIAKRMRRTLAAIKLGLCRRRHRPVGEVGRWLATVFRGWQGYHGVPNNFRRLEQFRYVLLQIWRGQLRRRSQTGHRWMLARAPRLFDKHVPRARITHPWPRTRHQRPTQSKSRMSE